MKKLLLYDDFQALPIGPFPSEYSAIGEYHYEAHKGRLGNWYESTNWHGWRRKATSAWMVIEDEGRHQLLQNLENVELALLNEHPDDGGLLDGFGRKVTLFPSDGHSEVCAEALDLNGENRAVGSGTALDLRAGSVCLWPADLRADPLAALE